ncbi:MAG: riboflavin synthase [Gemmatimonadota bacterium]
MFTGLVTHRGTIRQVDRDERGLELTIGAAFEDLRMGESIAVDGACLTVTSLGAHEFRVHIVRSSLDRTGFGEYQVGKSVNLERALQVGDRLGGHMVQGHVDGIGMITGLEVLEDALLIDIDVPLDVAQVSMPLGSVTVDGVSLTVNARPDETVIQVSIIPHTREQTTLGDRKVGDRVHLEADVIGKYVQHLMNEGRRAAAP